MSRQVDIKALVSHIVRGDGSDRCRICMGDTSEGQVHLEDTVMMDGDKPVTLAELLEVITGVEVEFTPPLPNNICDNCSQDITSFLPFLRLCKESAKRWSDISTFLNNYIPSPETKNVYIEIGDDIKTYIDTVRTVGKIETRKDALRGLNNRLRRHKVKIRGNINKQSKYRKFVCPECDAPFRCINKYNKHIGYFRKKKCLHCSEIFDFKNYKDHCKIHKLSAHFCSFCENSFVRKSDFELHKLKHNKGTHECVDCHETFATSSHLISHMNKHIPSICGCGKKFPNRICFNYHKRDCVPRTKDRLIYICNHCQASYTNKNVLRMHIKHVHMTGWTFQCDKCGKKMSSRSHLIEHSNIHEKVLDRFICHCGAKYSTRRGFQKHKKKHELEMAGVAS